MHKLRADSFASGLTPAQRDELYVALCGGMALAQAQEKVRSWGARAPSEQAISAWWHRERVARVVTLAREAGLAAQAAAPADVGREARAMLGQAKFLALLRDLSPAELAAFERNQLMADRTALERERLRLDREKFERLVVEKIADLAPAAGLQGEEQVQAIRRVLWGERLAEEVR